MNRLNHPTTWARTDRRETRYFNHRPSRLNWSVDMPGDVQSTSSASSPQASIERPAPAAPAPSPSQQPGELTFDFQPRWWPSSPGGAGAATQTTFDLAV